MCDCKIDFTNWNTIALLRASMVVAYYIIKLFRTGADKRNGILMSLLLQVAERTAYYFRRKSSIIDVRLLYIGLRKYWNFKSKTKVEQIIAIVTTQAFLVIWLSYVITNGT